MHEHQVQLRWSDFDALHHVNNVAYLEFMQDARVSIIESLGIGKKSLTEVGHVVARNEIDYLAPVEMDVSSLTVKIWVDRVGGASYNVKYEFVGPAGTLYARAASVMVTVDMTSGAVIRIPDDLREVLSVDL